MLTVIKGFHITLAALSILGFVLRGTWMLQRSAHLERQAVRVVPHFVDTLLLATGIILALGYTVNPAVQTWLAAKLLAIVLYIVLGIVALRAGRRNRAAGGVAFAAAVLAFAYIVSVAITKTPTPFV